MTTQSWNGKTILVTGGSGYLAAHIINIFLQNSYHVRTTVRSEHTASRVRQTHSSYGDRLSFAIVPDIAVPNAHNEAVTGVDGVIHTASPSGTNFVDNVRDLLDPAINGTIGILRSIHQNNPLIKRVVITSSFAAILDPMQGLRPGYIYTEDDWNPIDYETASSNETPKVIAYCASKKLAEKAAFDFVDRAKPTPSFSVSTICPPMIYGPALHSIADLTKLNTSSADIYRLVNGSERVVPETTFPVFADVRDVAVAHMKAYESLAAAGQRYALSAGNFTYDDVCEFIRREFPERKSLVPPPRKMTKKDKVPEVYQLSGEKARKELGIEYRSLESSIKDMVQEFIMLEEKLGA